MSEGSHSNMTIGATNFAFFYLSLELRPSGTTLNHICDAIYFHIFDMVKLQNHNVGFCAIDTGMFKKIFSNIFSSSLYT
jgi:hypothetical protein